MRKYEGIYFFLMALARGFNATLPTILLGKLPGPNWVFVLIAIVSAAVPFFGWLLSFGLWIYAIFACQPTTLYIVFFVLECLYFLFRLRTDRIKAE